MKTNKLLLLLLAMLLLSFTVVKQGIFNPEQENIGTIKQSLLKPSVFNNTQKGTWVLLNGEELSAESELFKILKNNSELNILTEREGKYYLPNALGRFIRCSNYNGVGVDPDATRLVGSSQEDEFKSHSHNYTSAKRNDVSGRGSTSDYAWDPQTYTTAAAGGAETRPKNISMYTYIKVNN